MKKFILSAAAVAALTVGGIAQADIIDGVGNTISRIFGVPYDPTPAGALPIGSVYTDAYGRQFQVDNQGRHIQINAQAPYRAPSGPYAMGPAHDRDGDGVANEYDRAPDDYRYR